MACDTPAPDTRLLPLDALDLIESSLYPLQHTCALISAFAGAHGMHVFTDGLPLEMFAVVFGHIGDELHDALLHVEAIRKELGSC